MPRLLIKDRKQQCFDDSERNLGIFQRNANEIWRRLLTKDEKWIRHYTPSPPPPPVIYAVT